VSHCGFLIDVQKEALAARRKHVVAERSRTTICHDNVARLQNRGTELKRGEDQEKREEYPCLEHAHPVTELLGIFLSQRR